MNPRSMVRELSIGLLTLGTAAVGIGVAKGLSHGHFLESGSNNRVAVLGGLALVAMGLLLRQPAVIAFLKRSEEETPAFLAQVQSNPLFHARLSFWFGVVAGLLESGYRVYHDLESPWPHSLWLAPLTSGVFFGSASLVLTTVIRDRGLRTTRLTLALILTMALCGWVLVVAPQIHPAAALVLAAGTATQLSRLLVRYSKLTWPFIANSGKAALFVTLTIMAWAMPSEMDLVVASDAVPSAAGGRNVVLVVLDTVSAKELSVLGSGRPTTPNLERWARRGVVFESAFSTAPWTLPSHAGMFTGRWAHELGDTSLAKMDERFPTIAEVMRDKGYSTSGFVANLAYATRKVGLARGFDRYEDFVVSEGEAVLSTALGRAVAGSDGLRNLLGYHEMINRKPASRVNADFLRWLDHDLSRPFFAFLNYFDAHEPYMPSEADAARFRISPAEDRGVFEHHLSNIRHIDWRSLSVSQVAQERALHEGAIAGIDREVGTLLAGMEARGLLANTVVIFTSDHGEAFGEHGVFSHGNSLYADLLHVPLLIIGPGLPGSVRVRETVSLRDLPETVLDLAGLETNSPFPGASLSRFWRPSAPAEHDDPIVFALPATPVPNYTPLARGTMYSVIADPYHFILNGDGVEELFNYRADPMEQRNLAGSQDGLSVLPRLRSSLPKRVN